MPARTDVTHTEATPTPATPQKLYIENTLLRVSGALFCHDAKRASQHTSEIFLDRGSPENTITIRPDPQLGQPGPLAHKVLIALIKKHSDYGRPVQTDISFSRREIGRLIGRKYWGGRDSEQLSRALHEIHYTFIKAHFKNNAGRLVEHSFNVFPQIWIERREFASDPIEACTVTLAEPIVASLRDEHFTCLNHELIGLLGTVGQALYMRLFFHFANLFDGNNAKALRFQKRYDDICIEWLGGLTILKHRSKILSEQLGTHLEQLVGAGFLSCYTVQGAKQRDGFVVTFHPGREFFKDYDQFYRRRQKGSQQNDTANDRRTIADPLRVAYLFAQKRAGGRVASIPFVPTKDVETAKLILERVSLDDVPAFIDYALAAAKKTAFDVQTLGGLKQYVAPYKDHCTRQRAAATQKAAQAATAQLEAEHAEYDAYRSAEALRIYETLPENLRNTLMTEVSLNSASSQGPFRSLDALIAERRLATLVIENYGAGIKTFTQWKGSQR